MGDLVVYRVASATELLAAGQAMLLMDEALHSRLLGALGALREDPDREREADLLLVLDEGEPVGVGVRTPPYPLQVSAGPSGVAAARALAEHLAGEAMVSGVIGPVEPAAAFRDVWVDRTRVRSRAGLSLRVHRATAVAAPRKVTGALRQADRDDIDLLVEWSLAFSAEALTDDPTDHIPAMIARVVGREPSRGTIYLWEVEGDQVSIAATAGPTPNAIRVLNVYTPPDLRGRGYASACVAAVTQGELDRGRREVHLSTDLANPTSNAIYTAIGYLPVGDEQVWHFEA